jgi:hypothetical protein
LFEHPKLLKSPTFERLINVIERSFPKRAPYDERFKKQIRMDFGDGAEAHILLCAIQGIDEPAAAEAEAEPPSEDKPIPTELMKKSDLLELKREYLAQRRQWVRGGKKGPEPKPPFEMPKT